jgi:transcriptional regulator with XRE-family HTH domain
MGHRHGEEAREIARIFSENLIRQRKLADVSQEDLAVLASVHRTEISQLERGMRIPRIDTAVKLASSLEVCVWSFSPGLTGSRAASGKDASSSARLRGHRTICAAKSTVSPICRGLA